MKQMVIVIQLDEKDTSLSVGSLALAIMREINDMGYGVTSISADGIEVLGNMGLNKNFYQN